ARRRLLKGGLGLAPVAMTVTSRPVLATGTCHGPTGFHSANLSRKVGTTPCTWKKPADWCTSSGNDWPTACKSLKDKPFKDVFGAADKSLAISNTRSVWWVISQTTNTADSCKIGKLIVAAWLNSAASPNAFPMTEAQVKEIWIEHNTVGFRPGGDTQAWDTIKIQKYLWYTMGVVF
ncbi:MAG: hypothetical protein ACOVQL_06500, partial [Limnohabitans sp.]